MKNFRDILKKKIEDGTIISAISYDENGGEIILSFSGNEKTENLLKRMAVKYGISEGAIICDDCIIESMIINLLSLHFDEVVDWYDSQKNTLTIESVLPGYNYGVYYTPDGEEHCTNQYSLTLEKITGGTLGIRIDDISCKF